jgi:hypothetical protein
VANLEFSEPGAAAAAPTDGTIVRWRLTAANEILGYQLNVLRAEPGGNFTVTASSAEVEPEAEDFIETFPTSLPIHAGEFIALSLPSGGSMAVYEFPAINVFFESVHAACGTYEPEEGGPSPFALGYNADLEPAPAPAPILAPSPSPSPSSVPVAHCIVPKLQGKKLKAAKKKLRAADCKLGTVTKEKGVTAATGKVVKQRPKPGKVLTTGAKVRVKLG